MVRLPPGGLVGDQRVGRGMGLVETVIAELGHEVEHLLGLLGRDAARGRAVDEGLALGSISARIFLPMARRSRSARPSCSAHLLRDLQHLLLVDHDAVGLAGGCPSAPDAAAPISRRACAGRGGDGWPAGRGGRGPRPRSGPRSGWGASGGARRACPGLRTGTPRPRRRAPASRRSRVIEREAVEIDIDALLLQEPHRALQDGERGSGRGSRTSRGRPARRISSSTG